MTSADSVKRGLFVSQAITPLKDMVKLYILDGRLPRFDYVRGLIILFNFSGSSRIICMMSLFFSVFALFWFISFVLIFFCLHFFLLVCSFSNSVIHLLVFCCRWIHLHCGIFNLY